MDPSLFLNGVEQAPDLIGYSPNLAPWPIHILNKAVFRAY